VEKLPGTRKATSLPSIASGMGKIAKSLFQPRTRKASGGKNSKEEYQLLRQEVQGQVTALFYAVP
jgi:hypothetical protein